MAKRKIERLIKGMQRIASKQPTITRPGVRFKRDWAYGNAGIENENITKEQARKAIST